MLCNDPLPKLPQHSITRVLHQCFVFSLSAVGTMTSATERGRAEGKGLKSGQCVNALRNVPPGKMLGSPSGSVTVRGTERGSGNVTSGQEKRGNLLPTARPDTNQSLPSSHPCPLHPFPFVLYFSPSSLITPFSSSF